MIRIKLMRHQSLINSCLNPNALVRHSANAQRLTIGIAPFALHILPLFAR